MAVRSLLFGDPAQQPVDNSCGAQPAPALSFCNLLQVFEMDSGSVIPDLIRDRNDVNRKIVP